MPKNPDDPANPHWGKYLGLGLEMAIGVGLGYVVGQWLDKKYGWAPTATLICTMLGLAGGMYLLIKEALKMNADPPPKTKKDQPPNPEDRANP